MVKYGYMLDRHIFILVIILAVLVGIALFSGIADKEPISNMENIILKSSAFEHEGNIPSKYACDGENIIPPLQIGELPEGTKSLALVVDDPDATGGGTFDHWILWNISPETKGIREGEIPSGSVGGENGFGNEEYGGPCPPKGSEPHRYMFKLYAIDSELGLEPGSSKKELEKAIKGHVLGEGLLMGRYGR